MGMKWFLFLIIAFTLPAFNTVAANGYVPPTCDAGLYRAITTKAHLESQREQMLNSNLLFKPDSVLEYSCFNAALNSDLAPKDTDFSESHKTIDLPGATNEMLGTLAQQYNSNNFGHPALGGHGKDPTSPGSNYTNCNMMNNIWRQAKCGDFQQNLSETAFLEFSDYANGANKRGLPQECAPKAPLPWKEAIAAVYPPGNLDMNEVYKKLQPGACGDTYIISTGVPLKYKTPDGAGGLKEGKICAAPGCSFNISGKSCN